MNTLRVYRDPANVHGMCEDYRASAGIDMEFDEADLKAGKKVTCPLHVLWASDGAMGRMYDVLGIWKETYGTQVTGARTDRRAQPAGSQSSGRAGPAAAIPGRLRGRKGVLPGGGGCMNRLKLLVAGMAIYGSAFGAAPTAPTAPPAAATPTTAVAKAPLPAPTPFELALVDLQGQKKSLGTLPRYVFAPRVSPDGTSVAFELADEPTAANQPQVLRLYVAELGKLDKRRALQPTVTSSQNLAPVWSDDGEWIAFMAQGNGADEIFWQRSDGSIQPKLLVDGRAPEGLYKGRTLVFITRTGDRDYGISSLDLNTKKVTRLIDRPGSEQHSSRISPDGRWIAYSSNETGRQEVWLEPYPVTGKRYQLTRDGGRHPVWAPDSKTIYFDLGGKMYRLALSLSADAATAATPVELPISGFQQGENRRQFDITPDGRAFLMLFPAKAAP